MLIHRSSSLVLTNITLTNIPLNKSGGQSLVRRSLVVDSSSSNKPDEESPQFNEKLIERIRKSQLFDQSYSGVWQQSSRPNAKQNARQQPAISLPADLQKYLPSVSKIISETMTEENAKVLEIWKAKMIKKLGWAGFQKYQNETLSRGAFDNLKFKQMVHSNYPILRSILSLLLKESDCIKTSSTSSNSRKRTSNWTRIWTVTGRA